MNSIIDFERFVYSKLVSIFDAVRGLYLKTIGKCIITGKS